MEKGLRYESTKKPEHKTKLRTDENSKLKVEIGQDFWQKILGINLHLFVYCGC